MTATRNIDRALLLLRIALGVVFVLHGGQKLFEHGLAGVTGFLASLGFPLPQVSAALLIAVELGGGLALLVGLFTRFAAALIAVNMLIAGTTVHLANGFFLPNGYEYTLTLMLVGLAVTLAGAGAYSLDARLFGHEVLTPVTETPVLPRPRKAA